MVLSSLVKGRPQTQPGPEEPAIADRVRFGGQQLALEGLPPPPEVLDSIAAGLQAETPEQRRALFNEADEFAARQMELAAPKGAVAFSDLALPQRRKPE